MCIAGKQCGDFIPFFLCIRFPNLLPADPQADNQSAGLDRLLKSAERHIPRHSLLFLIVSHIRASCLCTALEDLISVIVSNPVSADGQFRILSNEGSGYKEGACEPLKDLRPPFRCLFRLVPVKMRIGNLRIRSGHDHRRVKRRDISENSLQHIFPCLNPSLPRKPCIWTQFIIRLTGPKCHTPLLLFHSCALFIHISHSKCLRHKNSAPPGFHIAEQYAACFPNL